MCRYKLNTEMTKHTYRNHEGRMDHIVIEQILQWQKPMYNPTCDSTNTLCIFK